MIHQKEKKKGQDSKVETREKNERKKERERKKVNQDEPPDMKIKNTDEGEISPTVEAVDGRT